MTSDPKSSDTRGAEHSLQASLLNDGLMSRALTHNGGVSNTAGNGQGFNMHSNSNSIAFKQQNSENLARYVSNG